MANDYTQSLFQALILGRLGTNYFNFNRYWRKTRNLYSHTLVMFSQRRWLVQLFVFDSYLSSNQQFSNVRQLTQQLTQLSTTFLLFNQGLKISQQKLNGQVLAKINYYYKHQPSKNYYQKELIVSERTLVENFQPAAPAAIIEKGNFFSIPEYDLISDQLKSNFFYQPLPLSKPGLIKDSVLILTQDEAQPFSYQSYPLSSLCQMDWFNQSLTYFQLTNKEDQHLSVPAEISDENRQSRLDSTFFLIQPLVTTDQEPDFNFLFSFFCQQIKPRQARLQKLQELSSKINQEQQRVINNKVQVSWRILRYHRHGMINLWLKFIQYRISQRGVYQIRSVVYPLLRYVQTMNLKVSGWQLRCRGRFTRQQRADDQRFKFGQGIKPTSYAYEVDQAFFTVPLKFGAIGLMLTVRY